MLALSLYPTNMYIQGFELVGSGWVEYSIHRIVVADLGLKYHINYIILSCDIMLVVTMQYVYMYMYMYMCVGVNSRTYDGGSLTCLQINSVWNYIVN